MDSRTLAKFIKENVKTLITTNAPTSFYMKLDKDIAIYIGWTNEKFDYEEDNSDNYLHLKEDPDYCICVKIAGYIKPCHTDMWDYVWQPTFKDNDEAYDTYKFVTVDCDYYDLAKYYNKEYKEIKRLLKENKLEI